VIAFEQMQQDQMDSTIQQLDYVHNAAANRNVNPNVDVNDTLSGQTVGGTFGSWRRKIELWKCTSAGPQGNPIPRPEKWRRRPSLRVSGCAVPHPDDGDYPG